MIAVIFFFFGLSMLGWSNYATIQTADGNNMKVCVAVRCFHIFWIPLFPIKAFVVVNPSSSLFACRGEAHVAHFASWCNCYFWQAYGWAWLRFLSFGLLACCEPKCSDPADLMASLAISPAGAAAAAAGTNNPAGAGAAAGVIADNKTAVTSSHASMGDNKQRETGTSYNAIP